MTHTCRLSPADDHTLLRQGLASLLGMAADMKVVAEAADGETAVQQWQALRPDVVLLDIRTSGLGGLSAAQGITAIDPKAGIVTLSTYKGEEDIDRAVRAGVRGYLLTDVQADELRACVPRVCAGGTYLPLHISARLVNRVRADELNDRELQILALLAAGGSNKRIGRHLEIGEGTVKTHVRAILRKLDATSRTEAIAIAQRRGLVRL